jgi:hypothetical protein
VLTRENCPSTNNGTPRYMVPIRLCVVCFRRPVIVGYVLVQIPTQVFKIYVTMENPTIVTLVINSLILVMEEVHHRGGFPGDLKVSK